MLEPGGGGSLQGRPQAVAPPSQAPCQQALGTREPVVLLAEAIRRGVAGSLPVLVEIDTAYGTTLTLRPEHLDALARDQVTLKDGSRYHGTIKLKKG